MKKTIFTIAIAAILSACSSSSYYDDVVSKNYSTNEPNTEVYAMTRSGVSTLSGFNAVNPVSEPIDAYFYIRVDNRIPGSGSYPVEQYYPRKDHHGSPKEDYNKGTISNVKWTESKTDPVKYVYDTTGKTTPVVKEPDLNTMLQKSRVNGLNTDTLKVIWYIVKYESNFWHVDGVLTGKSTKDVTEVSGIDVDKDKINRADSTGHIEVDIHQQEHSTWQQIKTSIHVRDTVKTNVSVIIPIDSASYCKQDDTHLRIYEYREGDTLRATVSVTYNPDNITIEVSAEPQYVKELMLTSGDGITFEINNYVKKDIITDEVWKKLIESEVITDSKKKGQITSAYNTNKIIIK